MPISLHRYNRSGTAPVRRSMDELKAQAESDIERMTIAAPAPPTDRDPGQHNNQRCLLRVARPESLNDLHSQAWREPSVSAAAGADLPTRDVNKFKQLALTRKEVEKLHRSSAIINRRTQQSGATAPSRNGLTISWMQRSTVEEQEPADPRLPSQRGRGR